MSWRASPRKVIVPRCGRYTPLSTLSIELLPAPFGPMMARISCSRTSKETSCSARTPPKASDTFWTERMTSPMRRAMMVVSSDGATARSILGGLPGGLRREGLRVADFQICRIGAGAPVFIAHLRLDVDRIPAGVKRLDERAVLLGDVAPAHLARARELAVVRLELLVQDEK